MRGRSLLGSALAIFPLAACSTAVAQLQSMIGEQDFPDNVEAPEFPAAQAGEPPPVGVYQSSAGGDIFVNWNHTVSPIGDGTLTISLWDLDPIIPGNQVKSLLVNGVQQDTAVFELPAGSVFVRIHDVAIAQAALGSGDVSVSMQIDGRTGNVGIDFVRLTVVPEPSAMAAGIALAMMALARAKARTAGAVADQVTRYPN